MRRHKKRVTYAFIDSQNLNLGVQKIGWKMDWRKFRNFLQTKYNVSKAYMFIGHVPEFEDLYLQMHDIGYLVVLKPTQDLTKPRTDTPANGKPDGEDKKPIKGNIDAELVLWAMKELNNYERAIIVSGDGDFYCLAEFLEEQRKLGFIMAPNRQYSQLLNRFDKYIVRLDKLRGELEYKGRKPKRAATKQTPGP